MDAEEASESLRKLCLGSGDPGSNDYVKVTSPDENQLDDESKAEGSSISDYVTGPGGTGIKTMDNPANSSPGQVEGPDTDWSKATAAASSTPLSNLSTTMVEPRTETGRVSQEELRIPGSFHVVDVGWEKSTWQHGTGRRNWWQAVIRRFGL